MNCPERRNEIETSEEAYRTNLRDLLKIVDFVASKSNSRNFPHKLKLALESIRFHVQNILNMSNKVIEHLKPVIQGNEFNDDANPNDDFFRLFADTYISYAKHFTKWNTVLTNLKPSTKILQDVKEHGLVYSNIWLLHLITPIQRVPRYILLLKALRKTGCASHTIQKIISRFETITNQMNDITKLEDIFQKMTFRNRLGFFKCQSGLPLKLKIDGGMSVCSDEGIYYWPIKHDTFWIPVFTFVLEETKSRKWLDMLVIGTLDELMKQIQKQDIPIERKEQYYKLIEQMWNESTNQDDTKFFEKRIQKLGNFLRLDKLTTQIHHLPQTNERKEQYYKDMKLLWNEIKTKDDTKSFEMEFQKLEHGLQKTLAPHKTLHSASLA